MMIIEIQNLRMKCLRLLFLFSPLAFSSTGGLESTRMSILIKQLNLLHSEEGGLSWRGRVQQPPHGTYYNQSISYISRAAADYYYFIIIIIIIMSINIKFFPIIQSTSSSSIVIILIFIILLLSLQFFIFIII